MPPLSCRSIGVTAIAGTLAANLGTPCGTCTPSCAALNAALATGSLCIAICPSFAPARGTASSGATAALSNTVGVFRLASNEVGWTSDEIAKYGITFAAREAI